MIRATRGPGASMCSTPGRKRPRSNRNPPEALAGRGNSPDLLAQVMQRSSRHADEFGQRRRRVFSTPRNGRLQRIGRGAKRPIDHAILIDLAGGCRNQRNARARRHHPEDHLQMIDFVRRMRDER